jgi:uncharacterized protein (TIGR03118 family)
MLVGEAKPKTGDINMYSQRQFFRQHRLAALAWILSTSCVLAAGYRQTNLVSDETNAAVADPRLLNSWGIYVDHAGHAVVANNHSSMTTFYRANGKPLKQVVNVEDVIDVAPNAGRFFKISNERKTRPSTLLFATEAGTIEGWNHSIDPSNTVVGVDNSGSGASYKGLALAGTRSQPVLFAANFHGGMVEMYDKNFGFVKSFTDSNLTANGFAPFGIRNIGGQLFVTFAKQQPPDNEDEQAGPGLGHVDVFDANGDFVKRFTSEGPLNAPWGLALAKGGFGEFSHSLLVGNFGDGTINAFNPNTGEFLGQLKDPQGNVIHIDGLWGLAFGASDALWFAAGPDDEVHGLVGVLKPQHSMRY